MGKTKKIQFNKDIYSSSAIKNTIAAFESFAKFEFRDEKKYYIVRFSSLSGGDGARTLLDEICNYALAARKKCQ